MLSSYKIFLQCVGVHITKGMVFPTVFMTQGQKGMRAYQVPFGGALFFRWTYLF
jgi:hypothetical protein